MQKIVRKLHSRGYCIYSALIRFEKKIAFHALPSLTHTIINRENINYGVVLLKKTDILNLVRNIPLNTLISIVRQMVFTLVDGPTENIKSAY